MRLSAREPDGSTLRQHLQQAAQAAGRVDPQLLRRVPRWAGPLWAAFGELAGSRPQGMSGSGAIPYAEIEAWQRLHGVRLTAWEVDTIVAMDHATLGVAAEMRERAQ